MIVKRLLWLFLVGFFFYFLTTLPVEAGNVVEETGHVVESLFTLAADLVVEVIEGINS